MEWLARISSRANGRTADLAEELINALSAPDGKTLDIQSAEPHQSATRVSISLGRPDAAGAPETVVIQLVHAQLGGHDWSMQEGTEVWPGARVLARLVLAGEVEVKGKRVLEIGCGLGLAGLACARAGTSSTVCSDMDATVLGTVLESASLNGLQQVSTLQLDWSQLPPSAGELLGALGGSAETFFPFDLVVGADVVYEEGHAASLLQAAERLLSEGCAGEVLLVMGSPAHRDGVAALCRRLEIDEGSLEQYGLLEGSLSALRWSLKIVPGLRHGRSQRLLRLWADKR